MKKKLFFITSFLAFAGMIYFFSKPDTPKPSPHVQTVRVAKVLRLDVPRYLPALGAVIPFQDTVVQSRVDGYLTAIHFTEGQKVQKGDLLIEVDPRPFLVQLEQAKGALMRNEALLKNAQLDYARYKRLLSQKAAPAQQVQTQESLVAQYRGAVLQDKAIIADAELQLTYSKVTAPISGITGLRNIDIGTTIRSSDSAGIVRITQTQPSYISFTIIEKNLPDVRKAMHNIHTDDQADAVRQELFGDEPSNEISQYIPANGLLVEVWSQDKKEKLATGLLQSIDNQIDTSTGTVKAKAITPNQEDTLFPNQFVNVQLLVEHFSQVLTIPTTAIQRSNTGFFVYVVQDGKTVTRTITQRYSNNDIAVIETGLEENEIVVTDGVDRLRDGTAVTYTLSDKLPAPPEELAKELYDPTEKQSEPAK